VTAVDSLRQNWREYLIEAWALCMFMISASLFTVWLEHPSMPLYQAVTNADARRGLIGIAMGTTAIALIYSPWGKRSGAHMNPAVTVAFLIMRRVSPWNAAFYVLAQFAGGVLGVSAVWCLYGTTFSEQPVAFIATHPGSAGVTIAFIAELGISVLTMFSILTVSSSERWSRFTGMVAGFLIACYVFFESPLSGFSMNPARTFASALPGGSWDAIWIYFTAPLIGMWIATRLFGLISGERRLSRCCAKLSHATDVRCIHCRSTL
jgi:aquaporin Z